MDATCTSMVNGGTERSLRASDGTHGRGSSFQDTLKAFGQRVACLQKDFDRHMQNHTVGFEQELWLLLLELRPYFHIRSCSKETSVYSEPLHYRSGDYHRDLHHIRLTLRVYLAVLHMAAAVPGAVLHGCLTLLSLLPLLGDQSPCASAHRKRYIDGLVLSLQSLHGRDSHSFYTLLDRLFDTCGSNAGLSSFVLSPYPMQDEAYGVCTLEVLPSNLESIIPLVAKESSAVETSAKALFQLTISATSQYEVLCVVCSALSVFTELSNRHVPLALTIDQYSLLVDLSCSVLSLKVDEGGTDPLSGCRKRLRGDSEVAHETTEHAVHHVAGLSLAFWLVQHALFAHVHALAIATTLIERWRFMPLPDVSQWELPLLRWMAQEAQSTSVLDPPVERPQPWPCSFLLNRHLLTSLLEVIVLKAEDVLGRVDTNADVFPEVSAEHVEVVSLLVTLLEEAARLTGEQVARRELRSAWFQLQLEGTVELLLSAKVPYQWWLRERSAGVLVMHRLWRLLPRELAEAAVSNAVDCARESLSNAPLCVVEANALVFQTDGHASVCVSPRIEAAELYAANLSTVVNALSGANAEETGLLLTALVTLLRCFPDSEVANLVTLLPAVIEAMISTFGTNDMVFSTACPLVLVYAEACAKLPLAAPIAHKAGLALLGRLLETHGKPSDAFDYICTTFAGVTRGLQQRLHHWLHVVCKQLQFDAPSSTGCRVVVAELQTSFPAVCRQYTLLLQEAEIVTRGYTDLLRRIVSAEWEWLAQKVDAVVTCLENANQYYLGLMYAMMMFAKVDIKHPRLDGASPPRADEVVEIDVDEEVEEVNGVSTTEGATDGEGYNSGVPVIPLLQELGSLLVRLYRRFESIRMQGPVDPHENNGNKVSPPHAEVESVAEVVLQSVCLCVAINCDCTNWDDIVFDAVACSENPVLRCGYGSLALYRVMVRRCLNETFLSMWASTHNGAEWLSAKPVDASATVQRLEMLMTAFTHTWFGYLNVDDVSNHSLIASLTNDGCVLASSHIQALTNNAYEILEACYRLGDQTDVSLMVQSLILEMAHVALEVLGWSAEDVCRRSPHVVYTSFFTSICDFEDVDIAELLVRCQDVLLAPCILGKEGECDGGKRMDHLVSFLDQKGFPNGGFAAVMASILYRSAGSPSLQKIDMMRQLMQYLNQSENDIPPFTNRYLVSIILSLLSLEADAQWAFTQESLKANNPGKSQVVEERVDQASFDVFSMAVCQAVSLSECVPSRDGLLSSLESPVTSAVAGQALVKSVFDIIARISDYIGMPQHTRGRPPADGSKSVSILLSNRRRWLLALVSYIRVLGANATLIAAKLPAMLELCSSAPSLVLPICLVWMHLIHNCYESYLDEHAPAIVVELLSLEMHCDVEAAALTVLDSALQSLYTKTVGATFWKSCFQVMGGTSRLVQRLRSEVANVASQVSPRKRGGPRGKKTAAVKQQSNIDPAAALANEIALDSSSKATVVVQGFLSAMQSSSTKCKSVFVHALHQYLKNSLASQLEMTEAANANPHLIPTLLRCARELDGEDVQCALRCVGMIGAIAPRPVEFHGGMQHISVDAKCLSDGKEEVETDASVTALHSHHVDIDTALHWRTLAFTLLNVYCPRALANTADAGMHDRAAYGVQEMLRVCTKRERREKNGIPLRADEVVHVEELRQYSWWAKLSPKVQQMLEGFTTTRYTTVIVQQTERRTPEYREGMPYHTWVFAWYCNIASRLKGSFAEMIASLRNVVRRDSTMMVYLLPYMVVHLLEYCEATDWEDLLKEIDTVFAQVAPAANHERQLSSGSQTAVEVAPKRNPHSVDEHIQMLLHVLEDVNAIRWAMLRVGKQLDRPEMDEGYNESTCLRLAQVLKDFLDRIPCLRQTLAAVEIGSNMRALRSIESQRYLPSADDAISGIPLQQIFASLDDRDSTRRIHLMSHGLNPESAAFSWENVGEWSMALQSSELVLQHHPHSVSHQYAALRCMRQLGQLHLMSRYAEALIKQVNDTNPLTGGGGENTAEHKAILQSYANEAAWRLGEWQNITADSTLPASLAVPLRECVSVLTRKQLLSSVTAAATEQRHKIAPCIRAACREGYLQGYPYVAMLHALADVELVCEVLATSPLQVASDQNSGHLSGRRMENEDALQQLISALEQRRHRADDTLEVQEPLLALHRSVYQALGREKEVAGTWLLYAKLLRNAGFYEAALIAARQGDFKEHHNPSYCTLTAELLHDMGVPMQAIEFAQRHYGSSSLSNPIRAKLKLLITIWMQEIGSKTPKEVIASYEEAIALDSSEKAHHHLALFYDKLYHLSRQNNAGGPHAAPAGGKSASEVWDTGEVQWIEMYVLSAVEHYGKALLQGTRTVSVSLPRMLTLWLDTSAILVRLMADKSPKALDAERPYKQMNAMIQDFLLSSDGRCIPSSVVVTALPQLLSRLGHSSSNVVSMITRVIVHLMSAFPQPCLWMVLPNAFSKQSARAALVKKSIVASFVEQKAEHKETLEKVFEIFKSLIELCTSPASLFANNAKLTKQPFIQSLEKWLSTGNIILPTMANLSPNLSAAGNHGQVFPGTPTFHHFDDTVQIMSSLQKPKRIAVYSNEGKRVSFLCKAKDEPRKDIRMMEIASLMNTLFLTNQDARRKRFSLRRYAIAALTDDCAIIEWVNHSTPLRAIVNNCYTLDGTGVRISQVKAWVAKVESKSMTKMKMFTQHILPAAKPVLHQWFDMTFLNNQEWYQSRTLFTQSTALWSIAGHIVGLGDRHGENLMIDVKSGELMHVDFACMFDKGETLEIPERVRFRLTQNLMDGMGVLRTDGPFRANCEVALRCQLRNKNAVMSVVETLLHDPLMEWTSSSARSRAVEPKALIDRVSRRLDGFLDLYSKPREKDTLALNVEGQVSKLIDHSSALENLSEMYIWWMAWI